MLFIKLISFLKNFIINVKSSFGTFLLSSQIINLSLNSKRENDDVCRSEENPSPQCKISVER